MSTTLVTDEDYAFFDLLAPIVWPAKTADEIAFAREMVSQGIIQLETLLEVALAIESGGIYTRVAEEYRDFSDDSDAKKVVSCYRQNCYKEKAKSGIDNWRNSYSVSNVAKKIGKLRICAYSKARKEFDYYVIPRHAYDGLTVVDMLLDNFAHVEPPEGPQGYHNGKWKYFQVSTFKELATL